MGTPGQNLKLAQYQSPILPRMKWYSRDFLGLPREKDYATREIRKFNESCRLWIIPSACHNDIEVGQAERVHLFQKNVCLLSPQAAERHRKTSMMAISVSDICENTKVSENENIVSDSFNLSFFSAGPWDEPVGQLWDSKCVLSGRCSTGDILKRYSPKQMFPKLPF